MKNTAILSLVGIAIILVLRTAAEPEDKQDVAPTGKACDSSKFLAIAKEAEVVRSKHRLSEEEFAEAAADPNTVVLDARAPEFYERLHVLGALNLPYTHFSASALLDMIPDPSTRILIYCRNNFSSLQGSYPITPAKPEAFDLRVIDGEEFEFPTEYDPPEVPKSAEAGLNIPTLITLYSYGYKNVWELDDVIDSKDSPIKFARGKPKRIDTSIEDIPKRKIQRN